MNCVPQRTTLLVPFLVAVGAALFYSAKWVMLADAANISMNVTYVSRFVMLATYAFVAVMFRKCLPSVKNFLAVAVPFMLVYIMVSLFEPLMQDDMLSSAILYAIGVLYGISCALFTLLCAHVLSSFGPKKSAILFALSELLTNCLMVVLTLLDPHTLFLVRSAFLVTSSIIFLYVAHHLLHGKDEYDSAFQHSMERPDAASGRRPSSFPENWLDWTLLLVAAAVTKYLFGIIAQVGSAGGSYAHYDLPTDIVVILFLTILLVFLCFYGTRFGFATVLVVMVAFFATGFAAYPAAMTAGNPLAGALLRGGLSCCSVLLCVLVARKSYENPYRTSMLDHR